MRPRKKRAKVDPVRAAEDAAYEKAAREVESFLADEKLAAFTQLPGAIRRFKGGGR